MDTTKTYEQFPLWIPLIALLMELCMFLLGAYILLGFGILIVILYLLYCISMELIVVLRGCKNCYYYGKLCGMWKGRIAPLFTKKGDTAKFNERTIRPIDLLPDFLVTIFPLVGGIILSVLDFSMLRVGLMIILLVLSLGGTAVIRGSFACKYCKQREVGCPAETLFNKKQQQKIS